MLRDSKSSTEKRLRAVHLSQQSPTDDDKRNPYKTLSNGAIEKGHRTEIRAEDGSFDYSKDIPLDGIASRRDFDVV